VSHSFIFASHYCQALATFPEVIPTGPPLLPYFVLLHVEFALPDELLRPRCALTAPFHPYLRRGGIFSVALSMRNALSESPRPLAGTLSCGDRTFLSRFQERPPVRQADYHCGTFAFPPLSCLKHNAFCCSFLQFGSILLLVCRSRPLSLFRWVPK